MTLTNIRTFALAGIIILLTGLSGCKKSTYNQLSEDDMEWLAYQNNEILKFSNGSGDFINYYVTLRTKAYRQEGDTYNEFTTADFLQLNDTTAVFSEDAVGGLLVSRDDTGLLVTFSWPHFPVDGVPISTIIPTIETIGGIMYTDVYVVDASLLTDIRNYNSTVWVSKTSGVLQVQDTFGNTWVRVF